MVKINLDSLKYLYAEIKKNDKDRLEQEEINSFEDFKQYVLSTIIDNIEYDFGFDFKDYVDMNNFIEE